MNIVGFKFTKINAEVHKSAVGKVSINNNITLTGVNETKIGLGGDRSALSITWAYTSKYAPDLATLKMEGEVLMLADPSQSEEILKSFKENKQLPKNTVPKVMNHVLDRCNVQALLLSKDLNLPSPVPLPKVKGDVPATK
jgi:hypothetical protein